MKHLYTSFPKAALPAICILLIVGLFGCDFSGLNKAVDDFGVVIELQPINTSSTVLVKDAKSNKLITGEVEVTFNGPTGDRVIDIYSDPLAEKTISSGILNFGINNSVTPAEDSPAEVTLQLSADGYVSTNRTVTIESEGNSQYSVEMISKNDPPPGVEMESNTDGQADQDGTVQQNYKVEAISAASSTSSSATQAENVQYGVELEIPAGTVFKDIDGNPLTGQLTTDLTYYNPLEKEAMKSVPLDMKTVDGRRVLTYGMFAMEITDAKGKVAASASSESPKVTIKNGSSMPTVQGYLVNAQVCIDANFNSKCENAEAMAPTRGTTGRFNLTTLDNKFQNAPTLVRNPGNGDPNDNGPSSVPNLELRAPEDAQVVTPLTTLIQAQYEDLLDNGKNPLKDKPDIIAAKILQESKYDIDLLNADYVQSPTVEVSTPGYYAKKVANTARAVNEALQQARTKINDVPQGEVEVSISAVQLEKAINKIHNFHTDGNLEINLPDPPSNLINSATVEVTLSCENPGEKVAINDIPGSSVLYQRVNAESGDWSSVTNLEWDYDEEIQELTGGSFDVVGVELGADYTFSITYESTTYTRDITIDSENITYEETVSGGVCS